MTVAFQLNRTSLLNPILSLIVFKHYHSVFSHVMHVITCLGVFINIAHPLVNIEGKKPIYRHVTNTPLGKYSMKENPQTNMSWTLVLCHEKFE